MFFVWPWTLAWIKTDFAGYKPWNQGVEPNRNRNEKERLPLDFCEPKP